MFEDLGVNRAIIDRGVAHRRGPGARSAIVDRTEPASISLGEAERWWLGVTDGGVLCRYGPVASPGAAPTGVLHALVAAQAEGHRAREEAREAIVRRLGVRPPEPAPAGFTVVVCTHRRPDSLRLCLEALARLDPQPEEVIVVDNRPGPASARDLAHAFGARYAVEDRGGQNAARRLGAALARTELVAFTDDDCEPPPAWLRRAGPLMQDRSVGVVCGPVVAASVSLPEQEERERLLGFPRFNELQRFGNGDIAGVGVGAIGCGANMIVRRSALEPLAELLPDDLEGGTAALSGGDLYLLYRLMTAGHQIVHDPGTWVRHHHRTGARALERTAFVYGTGFAAFLTKAFVQHRELAAPAAWLWLVRRWCSAALEHAAMRDPLRLRVFSSYVLGGLGGGVAWLRARRAAGAPAAATPEAPPAHASAAAGVAVIAVDGAAARNRAARASEAEILLFLGEGAAPAPDLAQLHARTHQRAGDAVIVIGHEEARPAPGAGLAAQRAAGAANRRAYLAASALRATADDLPHSNLSISRAAFLELGGFDERLHGRGAARAFAFAALSRGMVLVHEPRAVSQALLELDARTLLASVRRLGSDFATMSAAQPELARGVELRGREDMAGAPTFARRVAIVAANVLRSPRPARAVIRLAILLEAARQRRLWTHLIKVLERAAFAGGWGAAGAGVRPAAPIEIDLAATRGVDPGIVTPLLALTHGSRRLGRLRPAFGIWHAGIAGQILAVAGGEALLPRPRRATTPGALAGCAAAASSRSEADALRDLGAEVHLEPRAAGQDRWREDCRALARSESRLLAFALGDTVLDPAWLVDVLELALGEDVAVVLGGGPPPGMPRRNATILREAPGHLRYRFPGAPPRYVVVRADHLDALGGLHAEAGALGVAAPALALAERAIGAGLAVAWVDDDAIRPVRDGPGVRREVSDRSRSVGALLARDARERGRGWLLVQLLGPWLAGPLPRPFRLLHQPAPAAWLREGGNLFRGARAGSRAP